MAEPLRILFEKKNKIRSTLTNLHFKYTTYHQIYHQRAGPGSPVKSIHGLSWDCV